MLKMSMFLNNSIVMKSWSSSFIVPSRPQTDDCSHQEGTDKEHGVGCTSQF